MTPEQSRKLDELYTFMQQLKRSQTIPKEVADAFGSRVGGFDANLAGSASSYIRSVNEGGSASYNVLEAPNRMVRIKVGGEYRLFPDFS